MDNKTKKISTFSTISSKSPFLNTWDKEQCKKRCLKLIFLFLFITCFLYFCIGWCGNDLDDKGSWFDKAISGQIDDIFGGDNINEIKNLIIVNFSEGNIGISGYNLNISAILNAISNVFVNLSIMLSIIYFCISIIDDFSLNQGYTEKILKNAIMLICSIALIAHSQELCYMISNIGSEIASKVATDAMEIISYDNKIDALKQYIYDTTTTDLTDKNPIEKLGIWLTDGFAKVGFWVQLGIPWLICKFSMLLMKVSCWSRFFNILVIATLSPLAIADMSKGNIASSSAMRMIKNIMAISLTGAVILIIVVLCSQIQSSIVTPENLSGDNFLGLVWDVVLISVVQYGMVKKATDIVKQALGMN